MAVLLLAVTSANHGTRSKGIIPLFHEDMAPCLVQCAIRPAYCFSIAAWPSFQASSSSGTLPASVSVSYPDIALRISQAPKFYFCSAAPPCCAAAPSIAPDETCDFQASRISLTLTKVQGTIVRLTSVNQACFGSTAYQSHRPLVVSGGPSSEMYEARSRVAGGAGFGTHFESGSCAPVPSHP